MNSPRLEKSWTRAAVITAASALVAICATVAAQAGDACITSVHTAGDAQAVSVIYSDLDIATDAGAMTLYKRINLAAHEVCGSPDIRDLEGVMASQRCERTAVAQAVNSVHSQTLAALVAVKTARG